MPVRRMTALCLAAALGKALAFNPIHEASYNLLPRGTFASSWTLQTAAIFESDREVLEIPFSLTLKATPNLEIGGGLKTAWIEEEDNFQFLVFGIKYQIPAGTALQADFLIGVSAGAGKGFSIAAHHRFGHSQRFYSRLTGRLGFLDALVRNEALMAMEAGIYPTLRIVSPLSLELGFIASSQTEDFNDWFALDMQPALLVHIGRESVVQMSVGLGLAGEQREDPWRAKVAVIYAF